MHPPTELSRIGTDVSPSDERTTEIGLKNIERYGSRILLSSQ